MVMVRWAVVVVFIVLIAGCAGVPVEPAGSRSVATPVAPVMDSGSSAVVNVVCTGDCYVGGGPSWVTSDVTLAWSHADPLVADYYEVWQSTMDPYFDPETCMACELATTTSGLTATVEDSPPGFNPTMGTEGADIMSPMDFFVVRAVSAGGPSDTSNRLGAVTFSLLQDIAQPPH